jgi:hypothetical protein
MDQGHLRVVERRGEGLVEHGRFSDQLPAQDVPLGRVAADRAVGVREREGVRGRARAFVRVDEDGALLVVRARLDAPRGGPAAQRGVRDQGDALAGLAAAQAAAQRGAALLVGQRGEGTARVVGGAELFQDVRGDGVCGVRRHTSRLVPAPARHRRETDIALCEGPVEG